MIHIYLHVLVDMSQNYLFLKLWRFKCIAALRAKNLRIVERIKELVLPVPSKNHCQFLTSSVS